MFTCVVCMCQVERLISFRFISFSVDSSTKRNFIAFQSNNNKFVPIDLLNLLSFILSLLIRFPWTRALATSTFVIRFALDGVKYSVLCFLKLTIQRFMRSLLMRCCCRHWAVWCYIDFVHIASRTFQLIFMMLSTQNLNSALSPFLSLNFHVNACFFRFMFIFRPQLRTLYNLDKYIAAAALQRTKSSAQSGVLAGARKWKLLMLFHFVFQPYPNVCVECFWRFSALNSHK